MRECCVSADEDMACLLECRCHGLARPTSKAIDQKIALFAFLRFILGDKPVSIKVDVYAQCQVVMLILGLSECLLFVWQLESTTVFTIKQNSFGWCSLTLRVLSQIHH